MQAGLHDFPLTPPVTVAAGSFYWLAIWSDDVNAKVFALPSGSVSYAAYPFGNWPNTLSFTGSTGFTYSIYATGTAPANAAPTCSAGTNQTISLPATASLAGTASDDGRPAALATAWNQESGPGTVTFGNAGALTTTAAFTLPGTYTLRLAANDGAVTSASNLTVSVRDSFSAWASRNGVAATAGDTDRDGLPNLLEYAFATDPAAQTVTPWSHQFPNGRLQITFPRDPTLTDLTYTVQASGNLASWTPIARSTAGAATLNLSAFSVSETPNGSLLDVTVTDASQNSPRFLRLNVSSP